MDYITETLKQYGIACETERFDAYVSNPAESMLLVNGTVVPSRSRSFAACCDTVTAELVYDRGTKETVSPREQDDSPADWHLFCHTTFIRQRNRMVTELTNLIRILKGELIL
ncbi:MAG: hypothetical protein SPF91_00855 [Clostridium sp.]|nr:hypothetical protein [Clostridium sp.]